MDPNNNLKEKSNQKYYGSIHRASKYMLMKVNYF